MRGPGSTCWPSTQDEPVGLLVAERDLDGREVFLDAYAVGETASVVQRALLERGLAAAGELARAHPAPVGPPTGDPYDLAPDTWQAVSASFVADRAYADVLSGLGFRPIRRFWRMLLDLASAHADGTACAGGREPARRVRRRTIGGCCTRCSRTSFAEHFGAHERGFEEWIASVEALPGTDPDRWWIATLDGTDVGLCILDDSKAEFGEGYVRTLGVIESARGTGHRPLAAGVRRRGRGSARADRACAGGRRREHHGSDRAVRVRGLHDQAGHRPVVPPAHLIGSGGQHDLAGRRAVGDEGVRVGGVPQRQHAVDHGLHDTGMDPRPHRALDLRADGGLLRLGPAAQ